MLNPDRAMTTGRPTVRIHYISSRYNMWLNNTWTQGMLVQLPEAIIFFLNINPFMILTCLRYPIAFQFLFILVSGFWQSAADGDTIFNKFA
jgi:hypothetical protein